jgi:hypothetical protein
VTISIYPSWYSAGLKVRDSGMVNPFRRQQQGINPRMEQAGVEASGRRTEGDKMLACCRGLERTASHLHPKTLASWSRRERYRYHVVWRAIAALAGEPIAKESLLANAMWAAPPRILLELAVHCSASATGGACTAFVRTSCLPPVTRRVRALLQPARG